MLNRGRVIGQMNLFSKYLYWFSAYERILHENGRVTIHCKDKQDFEIVKALTMDKDVYALQVGNSFSIFVKEWNKS